MINHDSFEGSEDEPEIVDVPMNPDELATLRRQNPNFTPAAANVLHEGWTDREVMLLAPLWDTPIPLSRTQLEEKLQQHPVLLARPGKEYYPDALHCYARYCRRRSQSDGEAWLRSCELLCMSENFTDIADRLDLDRALSAMPPNQNQEENRKKSA